MILPPMTPSYVLQSLFIYFLYALYCCPSSFLPYLLSTSCVLCSNCTLKTFLYSHSCTTFLAKIDTPLCGMYYGYPHHQNGLGHMLKSPNESCEASVILELVQSQGRKLKNPNENDFLSSCFTFQSELVSV